MLKSKCENFLYKVLLHLAQQPRDCLFKHFLVDEEECIQHWKTQLVVHQDP